MDFFPLMDLLFPFRIRGESLKCIDDIWKGFRPYKTFGNPPQVEDVQEVLNQ